jgi:hypothetical protein
MSTGLPRLAECNGCHDPIRFVRMTATGRAMPVNPSPSPDHGTIAARLSGGSLVGFVITKDHRPGPLDSFRFVPHYATCETQKPKSTTPTPAADVPLF